MSTENEEKQQNPQPEGEAITSMVTRPLPVAEGEARSDEGGGYDRVKPPQLFSGATEEDGAKAQEHCLGYNDVATAVWRVNPENHNIGIKTIWLMLLFPCPGVLAPFIFAWNSENKAILKGTLYILGQKNLYRLVDAADVGGCGLVHDGKDSGFEKLSAISSVGVDNAGSLLCGVSAVKVGVPFSSALAPPQTPGNNNVRVSDGGRINVTAPIFQMLVSEPGAAAQLIHQAKENANAQKTQSQEAPPQMQMQAQAAASPRSKKDELRELTEMRGEGLITENEFQEKRNKILSSY